MIVFPVFIVRCGGKFLKASHKIQMNFYAVRSRCWSAMSMVSRFVLYFLSATEGAVVLSSCGSVEWDDIFLETFSDIFHIGESKDLHEVLRALGTRYSAPDVSL